jgi:hypothetical protein
VLSRDQGNFAEHPLNWRTCCGCRERPAGKLRDVRPERACLLSHPVPLERAAPLGEGEGVAGSCRRFAEDLDAGVRDLLVSQPGLLPRLALLRSLGCAGP